MSGFNKLATQAQMDYIRDLAPGRPFSDNMSKKEASGLIDFILKNPREPEESPAHEFFKTHKLHGAAKEVALERAKFGLLPSQKTKMLEALNDVYGE